MEKREYEEAQTSLKILNKFIAHKANMEGADKDEIESELLDNHMLGRYLKKKPGERTEEDQDVIEDFQAEYIKRRALVDKNLLDNKTYDKSFALRKY